MKASAVNFLFTNPKLRRVVTGTKKEQDVSEKDFASRLLKLPSSEQEFYIIKYVEALGARLNSTYESVSRKLLDMLVKKCGKKSHTLQKRVKNYVKNALAAHEQQNTLLHQTAYTLLKKSDFHKFPGEDLKLSELHLAAQDQEKMLQVTMQITKQLYDTPHPKIQKLLKIEREQKLKFFMGDSPKTPSSEFQYERMHMVEFPQGNRMTLLRHPAPATIGAYFAMAFREKTPLAVTLCSPSEHEDLIPFWNDKYAKEHLLEDWEVTNVKTKVLGKIFIKDQPSASMSPRIVERKLRISYEGQSHLLTHIHYENWPDHGLPDPDLLRKMIERCEKVTKDTNGQIIINCRGGVGRTATFAVINICRKILRDFVKKGVDVKTATINIPEILYSVRLQRPRIYCNPQQMSFLYKMVGDYYNELIGKTD